MNKILIKQQGLATRCEICYQSDFFEPLINKCKRCDEVALEISKIKVNQQGQQLVAVENTNASEHWLSFRGVVFFLLVVVVISYEFVSEYRYVRVVLVLWVVVFFAIFWRIN
jgi:hypothetical protein